MPIIVIVGFIILVIPGLIALVLWPISRIVGFTKLNTTFKKISETYPEQQKLDSGYFIFYAFYGIISVIPQIIGYTITLQGILETALADPENFNQDIVLPRWVNIIDMTMGGISMIVNVVLGYILIQNDRKLETMIKV